MSPNEIESHHHYRVIEKLVHYLIENHIDRPSLQELSRLSGLSEFHLQRVFSEWVGVSPNTFLGFLTKEYAKKQLQENSLFETSLKCGLSGSSRLHDLFIKYHSMTPAEYKKGGEGLEIRVGVFSCIFGYCLLAATKKGLCKLVFFDEIHQTDSYLEELRLEWPKAIILEDKDQLEPMYKFIFLNEGKEQKPIHLLLKGSPFRLSVWEALLSVPEGQLVTYTDIAEKIQQPNAVRAVASAIASNPVAYLIPCHRVIRSSGELNQYRWGASRKAVMIAREQVTSCKKEKSVANK